MSKNLIIYYSRKGQNYVNGRIESLTKGNTEICAEFIQKAVGGDLFEVETVNGYSSDYHACTAEAKTEYENNTRPEHILKTSAGMTIFSFVVRAGVEHIQWQYFR